MKSALQAVFAVMTLVTTGSILSFCIVALVAAQGASLPVIVAFGVSSVVLTLGITSMAFLTCCE
jgi:hypothetical protein